MRAILASGGTGGHMYPALALASELRERGHEVLLVTDERGARFVGKEFKVKIIPAVAFFGRSIREKLRALGAFIEGRRESIELIEEFHPDLAIGAGGYTSFALIQAASAKRVPLFLIEQNSVPGRVTRIASRKAREIYCGIPPVRTIRGNVVLTGNILRKSVVILGEGSEILVQGGSQGATRLNELGYELAQRMPKQRFVILTGSRDFRAMKAKPTLQNLDLVEFTEHPEKLYARAKLAISRAGALALSELCVNGIPSILVPFPYAVDNHQLFNARWAEEAGAAVVVEEKDIERVHEVLEGLLGDKARRERMSNAGRKLVPADAAQRIVERIQGCLAG